MTRSVAVGPRSPEWRERFRGQFAKTRMCRFSSEGECRYGAGCTFAHSVDELTTPPDLVKTSLCVAWEKGSCTVASQFCPFAHGEVELRATAAFAEQPLSRKLRTLGADSNAPLQPPDPPSKILNSKTRAFATPDLAPRLGTWYDDRDQRLLHHEQSLQNQFPPCRTSAEALAPGWVMSCGSGQASTDDTSSSPGDGSGGSDDTKGQRRCRRGRRSIEGMLRRKERHERHRVMVANQRENRMDQADCGNLSMTALGRMPAKPQPLLEMLESPELLPQAPRSGMSIAPERAPPAAELMAARTQPSVPHFYYMQPQMQPPLYQPGAGVGIGMDCPYKAWEVEGILRSAMPQQYED